MKKYSPYIFIGVGLLMFGFSRIVGGNGLPGASPIITNLVGWFTLIASGVCVLLALVLFCKRDDPEDW